jgi:hypothetical protein
MANILSGSGKAGNDEKIIRVTDNFRDGVLAIEDPRACLFH